MSLKILLLLYLFHLPWTYRRGALVARFKRMISVRQELQVVAGYLNRTQAGAHAVTLPLHRAPSKPHDGQLSQAIPTFASARSPKRRDLFGLPPLPRHVHGTRSEVSANDIASEMPK
jgi:hypothetical protein